MIGNVALLSTPVRILFTFFQDAAELGSELVEIPAPATAEVVPFDVLFPMRANGFRYQLLLVEAPRPRASGRLIWR